MTGLDQFSGMQYLNIETFRKNGASVKTPVWFVQDGATIYVRTIANSGKVKRIRNCGDVNIAPCKADGTPLGDWVPAAAQEVTDRETARRVNQLLDRKYGLQKKLFGLMSWLQRREETVLEIKPANLP